ncbi:MmcQ/YjbR family DNA-binding protein [Sphaerisporangium corydalis]|uniref:MmcQ/YjbR family DNA-binding protein n=1 Tax=Sphaerisporangium corydalis TaxID=1441875 RepID=A0ABV9E901_9ACTN|nr:MmcQ/YjbR family DNA-binding protein [Sphaerisporangium corydalis]
MVGSWTDADVERVRGRLEELVAGLPGVVTEDAHGHIGLLVRGKRLAWVFIDHHGDGRLALCVKAPPGELETLVAADLLRYFRPAYVRGWVGVELHAVEPDWAEIGALLEQAWRMRAGKHATAAYDARRPG